MGLPSLTEWTTGIGLLVLVTVVHELGHVLAARLVGFRLTGWGLRIRPVPFVYVQVEGEPGTFRWIAYYLAGPFAAMLFGIGLQPWLDSFATWIVAARITLDFNPFFSDFTLMNTRYRYTCLWYGHLATWSVFLIVVSRRYFG